jgi:hypothetical protein
VAPPHRTDEPRHEGANALEDLKLSESRMGPNAARLASWVEWLLHPEEHEYDRTVIYSDGTKREEPGPVSKANPTPGEYDPVELEFETVLAQYPLVEQYLDGMAAFSTQQVERPNSLLSRGAAAIKNVWWAGDKHMMKLVHEFPDEDEWSGDAAAAADAFIGDMSVIVTQLNKIVFEFGDIGPHYALIVKNARDNFDQAAADLVTAFEEKFHTKASPAPIDIMGIALTAVAAGAVTYMSGGLAAPIVENAILTAWSTLFSEAAEKFRNKDAQGSVDGFLWSELAQSYMRAQADILNDAVAAIDELNTKIERLLQQFNKDIQSIVEAYKS